MGRICPEWLTNNKRCREWAEPGLENTLELRKLLFRSSIPANFNLLQVGTKHLKGCFGLWEGKTVCRIARPCTSF